MRVLLVEDDLDVGQNLLCASRAADYGVDWVRDGKSGLDAMASAYYAVVLLNPWVPRLGGIDFLKSSRAAGNQTPVLLLAAHDDPTMSACALDIVVKKEVCNWTFSGGVDGGLSGYDSTRNVTLPGYAAQAKGAFNAYEAGLHSRVAYILPMNDSYVKPYVDVHLVHMHTNAYTEQGAGALDLAVNSANATTLSVSPMLEVGGRWTFANGMTLRPDLAVGGVFHNRNYWDANAQFVGSAPGVAPFSAVASAPSSLAKVKVGMNPSVSKRTELKLEYGGQFGSGYSSNEGILRVNYLF
ncbi:autotransporter domain-containing protein [Caballeronia cordobensis]|uniref:autotransporter domain-containing protein n=1 Tax=Caballeronia cordobensis TaxID=1353886 RepID=UPI00045EE6B0|nr:two component transcriptional regulator, winged helix family [Burkholderia sp. RPE67]